MWQQQQQQCDVASRHVMLALPALLGMQTALAAPQCPPLASMLAWHKWALICLPSMGARAQPTRAWPAPSGMQGLPGSHRALCCWLRRFLSDLWLFNLTTQAWLGPYSFQVCANGCGACTAELVDSCG